MSQTPKRQRKSLLKPGKRLSAVPSLGQIGWMNQKSNATSNLATSALPNLQSATSVARKITFSHNENDNGNASVVCPKVQTTNSVLNGICKRKIRHSMGPNFLNNLNSNTNAKNKAKRFVSLPKQSRKMITIHIDSLWSTDSETDDSFETYIELAMLALLDDDNHPIPILNIATIPDSNNMEDLNKLLDMNYDKGNQIFRGVYNQKTKFSFILSIEDSYSPKTLRIWNPDAKNDYSVKDISVYEGSMLVANGTVPQQFGMNLPLIQNDYINPDLHPKIMVYCDKFGIMPIKQIQEVQIYFTESYCMESDYKKEVIKEIQREKEQQSLKPPPEEDDVNVTLTPTPNVYKQISSKHNIEIKYKKFNNTPSEGMEIQYNFPDRFTETENQHQKLEKINNNPLQVGLNGIDFVNLSGELLTENDIKEVTYHGMVNISNFDKLFRENKEVDDSEEMFIGDVLEGKIPYINIKFREPQYLSRIFIWNYNSDREHLYCGIKAAKVYFDGKLFWYGKIPMGVGNVHNIIHSIRQIPINQPLAAVDMYRREL